MRKNCLRFVLPTETSFIAKTEKMLNKLIHTKQKQKRPHANRVFLTNYEPTLST